LGTQKKKKKKEYTFPLSLLLFGKRKKERIHLSLKFFVILERKKEKKSLYFAFIKGFAKNFSLEVTICKWKASSEFQWTLCKIPSGTENCYYQGHL